MMWLVTRDCYNRLMKNISSFDEAVTYLLDHASDLTRDYQLDRMRQVLAALDNPQEKFKSVHIAGTSGKTSTSYFIRALLEAGGQRTGLTVSPHIVAVNERVQIAGVPIDEAKFLTYFNEFLGLMSAADLRPTYFESLVALAYWIFAQERLDYVVVETGFGGLLDGTNTIQRPDKVCVITNIGLDHTHILGDTVEKIAYQKAGIIQPHNYVLVRSQQDSVMEVFRERARMQHATLQEVDDLEAPDFLPEFQHQNWAMAWAAYEYLQQRDGLPGLNEQQREQAAHQTPPGRGEIYRVGDKTIILDGAHNPQKLEIFIHSLAAQGYTSGAVLASIVEAPDTKLDGCIHELKKFATHWIVPEFQVGQDLMNRHSFDADYVIEHAGDMSCEKIPDIHEALVALLLRPEDTLLITGSLYLVSLLRPEILKLQRK